jgi:hypothetical protein
MEDRTDSTIINALRRLERIGSESSRQTEKLVTAVERVADLVTSFEELRRAALTGGGPPVALPRGYNVSVAGPNGEIWLDSPRGRFLNLRPDRDSCLDFARDVATGWLSEVADWLRARGADSDSALGLMREAVCKEPSTTTV